MTSSEHDLENEIGDIMNSFVDLIMHDSHIDEALQRNSDYENVPTQ